jgi:formyltetrahydrofolate deformylase
MTHGHARTARLLIACPDARGIVAAVATFIRDHGGNLLDAEQHTDEEHGEFFMRAELDPGDGPLGRRSAFEDLWRPVAEAFGMTWRVRFGAEVKRMAILVGKQAHCLHDLLWRWQAGELPVEIPIIISNHETLAPVAANAGVSFVHLPIEPGPAGQAEQEAKLAAALDDANADFIVLARYMRILSDGLSRAWAERAINIHHSFLPAFAGGDPYRQAYDRGVKIIGATSHYVTPELDAGPIIAQETIHVSHRDTVADLKRRGRDLERLVLARAVRAHVEDRVLVSKNKTVVFGR